MIHTLKKAREKWCPMARFYMGNDNGGLAGINRTFTDNIPTGTECIADECMWWKWDGDLSGYCGKVGR